MPRPRAARPGSVAYAVRPRRELTWVRPRSHGVAAGRRRPAEADARGGLSLLHLLLAGRREAATAAQPARDALLEEEGIPGRPHPAASLSPPLTAGPAPPLPTGAAARRAGACGYLRAPAHRNSRSPARLERLPARELGAGSAGGWEAGLCGACRPNMAAGARRAAEGA